MYYNPQTILNTLLACSPRPTANAPKDTRGLYGLIDHRGDLRYIGSTSSNNQTLYQRIHQRHRTGSEGMSHYFSHMYNVGRMWRNRLDKSIGADGARAKALRNAFISDHCRAIWLPLPDSINIALLEREVLAIAPAHAIAWNGRAMKAYDEPVDLVDATIARLGWGPDDIAAVERQGRRYSGAAVATTKAVPLDLSAVSHGDYRFFALDVETASYDRAHICQIGIAGIRADNSIESWVTYVDPQTDHWPCSSIHGITPAIVDGAPSFRQVFPLLQRALADQTVYQHSDFDRSAIVAACTRNGLPIPSWDWKDSLTVARAAWPELKSNGGYGLASIKRHLGLSFKHHHAGEDARASAEIVLRAEAHTSVGTSALKQPIGVPTLSTKTDPHPGLETIAPDRSNAANSPTRIGRSYITQGNINNNHIYLREFFGRFPADVIGGSNKSESAPCQIIVEWGGPEPVVTDLDGQKKFFRKRGWIKEFFSQNGVVAGSIVSLDEIGHLRYCVSVIVP